LARPQKWRKVEFIPSIQRFIPVGVDLSEMSENILKVEEIEAIRLKDIVGLEQEECAEKMQISRQTYQRILNSGRNKIADSIINGKAIRIEGGNFTRNICLVSCLDCKKEWKESYENLEHIINGSYMCPGCQSKNIVCVGTDKHNFCKCNCWRKRNRGNV